jgi:uncharacterized protein with GYD domain
MKRLSAVLFVAGALLVLATVAAACGGDDSDERAREYFEEIVEIAGQHEAEVQAAQATYDAVLTADAVEDEVVTAFISQLAMLSTSIRAETADREEVDPPPEIEEEHLELLAAARQLAKVYEDLVEGASDATTASQLNQALQAVDYRPRLEEAQGRAKQACTRLQALADESGIETKVC